jgi:alkanesulfonate monooxygenase SsuD/methylene tetrahydromethanopterin reductase-like flavin-dependent oxidoreductase (luciferase family)
MRVCLMIEGQDSVGWDQWTAIASAAEAADLEGLFRSDHYLGIVRGAQTGGLDAWTTLAALAARTDRLRLGTLVSPVTFRPASVLAKSAVTVDHVSGGRVELGIGAGWYEQEHEAYGFPFPPLSDRFDLLEAQLAEINRQWSEETEHQPKPLQRPRPPIIVGGRAKPRSARLAATYADEYNSFVASVAEAGERRAAVDRAAADAGRPPLRFSIMLTCVVGRGGGDLDRRLTAHRELTGGTRPPLAGTVEEVAARLREYADVGVDRVMLQHLRHEDVEMIELFGEVAAALR